MASQPIRGSDIVHTKEMLNTMLRNIGHLFEKVQRLEQTTDATGVWIKRVGGLLHYHIVSEKRMEAENPRDRKMLPLHQKISNIWNQVASLEAGFWEAKILRETQVKVTQKLTKKVDEGYKELVELASSSSEETVQKLTKVLKTNGITQKQTTRYNRLDQEGKPDKKGNGKAVLPAIPRTLRKENKTQIISELAEDELDQAGQVEEMKDLKKKKSWLDIQLGIQEPPYRLLE